MEVHPHSRQNTSIAAAGKSNRDRVVCLPIAPQTVARTRFCPPASAKGHCLMVPEAIRLLDHAMPADSATKTIAVLAGPGDPLASAEPTLEAAHLIKRKYPAVQIGLRTAGIGSFSLAAQLAEAGVSYLEMQVEGVRQEILEKLFAWIRPGSKTLQLSDAANLLLQEQRNGVSALTFHGITVSIATTLYPGYNMDHVPKISAEMMELGAQSISLTPYTAEPGVEVELEPPSHQSVCRIKKKAALHLPVVDPILADSVNGAAGSNNISLAYAIKPSAARPNIAATSSSGINIDLHLGHAVKFLIYGPRHDGLNCLLETREAPEAGAGENRWKKVAAILDDCFAVLTASAGSAPRKALSNAGIQVYIAEDNIEGLVDALYGGDK